MSAVEAVLVVYPRAKHAAKMAHDAMFESGAVSSAGRIEDLKSLTVWDLEQRGPKSFAFAAVAEARAFVAALSPEFQAFWAYQP